MGEKEELERKIVEGILRVESMNDRSNLQPVTPRPLEKVKLLHQISEGEDYCLYCRKPSTEWEPMEECKTRYK